MEEEEEHVHIMKDSKYDDVESEVEEEALSLCDLPLNENSESLNDINDMSFKRNILRPSSLTDSTDFFSGFSSSSSSDMCPADDIIFCGKLVPFKETVNDDHRGENLNVELNKSRIIRRRSESVSSVIRSNSVSNFGGSGGGGGGSSRQLMRNSRSLNYCRLRESSNFVISKAPEVDRNSSVRSVASSEGVAKKAMKPRWYSLMFGKMKVPPEMELNDIKNRQVRRNPSKSMFPASDSGENLDLNRSSGKVSWKILKALSCKDHNSVAVTTTSFSLPQASS
ncbi:uncharacterized protein LOC123911059 [Trifolium pratense]|uniref:uncharacterized protein LOC123911059 n=1 Tax=Trifolium pratense TaxID=57577 RepID=UPI001E69729D|nr:uncharacterized protein LOC123911059 [Trifolium pratense]